MVGKLRAYIEGVMWAKEVCAPRADGRLGPYKDGKLRWDDRFLADGLSTLTID